MKIERAGERALHLGLFSFFVLITIGYISTTNYSRVFIEPLRMVAALALAFFMGIILLKIKPRGLSLTGPFLYISLLALGIFLAMLNESLSIGSIGLAANAAITLCGILLFCYRGNNILPDRFAAWFVAYVAASMVFTLLIHGLEFTPFPRFNFEYDSGVHALDITYSQELSRLFGFGAMAAAFLAANKKNRLAKCYYFILILIFLAISFLGGARGDSVAAFIMVVAYWIISNPVRSLPWLALVATSMYAGVPDWSWLDNLSIFQRLMELNDDLGHRDILISQSFSLLLHQPSCLIFGCGFGYFQTNFRYPYDMYPHNILIELLIVFGAPITLAFIFSITAGIWKYYRRCRELDLLVLFFIYSLLVGLKSGSLFGDWFFTAGCIYFSSFYLQNIVIGNPPHHPAMRLTGSEA